MNRSDRNPFLAGIVGLAVLVLGVLGLMRLDGLPLVGGDGVRLTALFVDSSGLEPGDRVEIAGIEVGVVEDVRADGPRVAVEFTADPTVALGDRTRALIRVGDLLGSKYLELEPEGTGTLDPDEPIGLDRTTPAYDVVDAFADLSETVDEIDTDRLADSLDAIATTFDGSSTDVQAAVRGLSRISRTITDRDAQVASLLGHSNTVATSLDASREDLTSLLRDATLLLAEIDRRRVAFDGLIEHTRDVSDELGGLVSDTQDDLTPALQELDQVTELLQQRQEELAETVASVAKFARVFSNVIGSGPWFDSIIANGPSGLEVVGP